MNLLPTTQNKVLILCCMGAWVTKELLLFDTRAAEIRTSKQKRPGKKKRGGEKYRRTFSHQGRTRDLRKWFRNLL